MILNCLKKKTIQFVMSAMMDLPNLSCRPFGPDDVEICWTPTPLPYALPSVTCLAAPSPPPVPQGHRW